MAPVRDSSIYQTRRWTRAEYARLIDTGVFHPDERLELIGGELIVRERRGASHSLAIELINEALRAAFGAGWRIRVQLPVALDDESEPEPDFSIVPGTPRQAPLDPKPARPALVVEVAETTLAFDRKCQEQPLRPSPRSRLLDRQSRGSSPRNLSRARCRRRGAIRLALQPDSNPSFRRFGLSPRASLRSHRRRRPAAIADGD
jgi:hypothetical protein